MKRLLREAMNGLLPAEIANRPQATTFNAVVTLFWQKNRAFLEALLAEKDWLTESFVDRRAVRQMFDRVEQGAGGEQRHEWILNLLDLAQFERWLRNVYNKLARPFSGVTSNEPATCSAC